jgi:hypothetical protein
MNFITTKPSPEPRIEPTSTCGVRVWAGAALLAGALVLVILGGCFLVGALILVRPEVVQPAAVEPSPLSPEGSFLLRTLYLLAVACFLGALLLFFQGARGLIRILLGKRDAL